MEFRHTRHQVARGSRPDAEHGMDMYLLKNVSRLRATYQVRLLTYRAAAEGRRLVIRVPKECEISADLRSFVNSNRKHIRLEKVP